MDEREYAVSTLRLLLQSNDIPLRRTQQTCIARHAAKKAVSVRVMALSRQDVILSCLVAFISWTVLTTAFPGLRFAPYAFVAGLLVATLGFLYVLVSCSRGSRDVQHNLSIPSSFLAFSSTKNWLAETKALEERSRYSQNVVYTASLPLSKEVDTIIGSVIRDFLKSWYGKISRDAAFINEVDRAIRVAAQAVIEKVVAHDLVDVGVTRLLPIINGHIKNFSEAERLVRGKNLTLIVTEADEVDLAIATKYHDGRLHPAASLAVLKTTAPQQQHMRRLVGRLVTELLPENMTTSASVLVLIREILACAVLVPALHILSDPDTLCQLIEAYVSPM